MGVYYRAHRVAWAITHGEWPTSDIDHINGVRDDNRICNLRAVTRSQNRRNSSMRSDNKSGITGVALDKKFNVWRAQIHVDGKHITLGAFPTFEAAVGARRKAALKHGFTERHGT